MKAFSITTLSSLAVSAVSRVPSATEKSASIDIRNSYALGCQTGSPQDQYVKFYSLDTTYGMWIPTDGSNYNIGHPSAQIECSEVAGTNTISSNPCKPCWDKMLVVELTLPGSCDFALTDQYGSLFSTQIDHSNGKISLPTAGYLALATCHRPEEKITRSIEDLELSCERPNDVAIKLNTGSQEYLLPIPANQTVFSVIGPDSNLGCIGPLGQGTMMCQACNFPVQSLELTSEAGTCALDFSGYTNLVYHNSKDGILNLSNPTQIRSIACGLDNAVSVERETLLQITDQDFQLRSLGSGCLASAYGVTFNTTETSRTFNQTYMAVPSDQQYYNLEGQSAQLGCYFFRELDGEPCQPCYEYEIVSLSVSEHLWECRFKIAGWTDVLVWPVWHTTPMEFDPPIKVIGVQCGLGERWLSIPATDAGDIEASTESADLDILARYNPNSAEFLCEDSGYNISIFASDGNVYCPPVPVDFEFHPMSDMYCLRPADHVLVNCTQIVAAIAVNSVGAWGPCIFFTEDHRSFFTDFITSPIVRAQIIPGNAISGVSCGSGLAG